MSNSGAIAEERGLHPGNFLELHLDLTTPSASPQKTVAPSFHFFFTQRMTFGKCLWIRLNRSTASQLCHFCQEKEQREELNEWVPGLSLDVTRCLAPVDLKMFLFLPFPATCTCYGSQYTNMFLGLHWKPVHSIFVFQNLKVYQFILGVWFF